MSALATARQTLRFTLRPMGSLARIPWLCCALAACSHTYDPCPEGTEAFRDQDRCIPLAMNDASANLEDAGDAAQPRDAAQLRDGASASDAAATDDAQTVSDAAAIDGGEDAHSPADASQGADSALPDASDDTCDAHDVQAWEAFHQREGLTAILLECITHGCKEGDCPASACIRSAAQLTACEGCTYEETMCVLAFCGPACGRNGSDLECLACACEAGCVDRFNACADASLAVCEGVHGRTYEAEELELPEPWLVRAKSATGAWHAGPLLPSPPEAFSFPVRYSMARGFTHLTAFELAGRALVLQHKSRCGDDPCLARIWPLLREGSLGRPLYAEAWTRGWDEVEVLRVGDELFLLRYKTGEAPSEVENAGTLRVERIVLDAGEERIVLEPLRVHDSAGVSVFTWSSLEAFALAGRTYLVRYSSARSGAIEILRIEVDGQDLTLTPVSQDLTWSRGWDIMEAFEHGGRPYLLAYKSGRTSLTQEPAGSVRIVSFFAPTASSLAPTAPVYEDVWEAGFTRLLTYRRDGVTNLLKLNATTGAAQRTELPAEPSAWSGSLRVTAWSDRWGANPPWDIVEVVESTTVESGS